MQLRTRGVTLIELLLALALLAVLISIAVPRTSAVVDRLRVRGAAQDIMLGLASARSAAVRRSDFASFVVDPVAGRIRVVCRGETLFARDVAGARGVRLEATRESITYAPTGMGWGAANTKVVVSRGGQTDTIVTSRLGRVRKS